ncbi:MAG: response regulator, partial [Candidatus Binatia bacterium]
SYGLELIGQATHRMEDLLANEICSASADQNRIDQLLAHNDRLAVLTEAYLCGDWETLNEGRRHDSGTKARDSDSGPRKTFDRVLIVEPSAATLQLCVQVLSGFGAVRVSSVRDGYEALGWLLREPFHAVVTSLQVPSIDGHSLAAVLRTIPGPNSATPVVLLTSAAAALDPSKVRPEFVVEKSRDLSIELHAIFSRLTGRSLSTSGQTAKNQPADPKKILLVDDSPDIHDLVRLSFKRCPNVEIIALLDPTHAVEYARKEAPELILLDVQMLPLSGKDILKDLKADSKLRHIPVAFFTGNDTLEEKQELAALGAWQILRKPFSPKTFAEHVLSLYRKR